LQYLVLRVLQARKLCFLLVFSLGLSACEAPLNLSGVEQELAKHVHRYDQFQAVARNGQQLVVVGSAGAVLVSDDDGQNWQRQELPGRPSLIDVALCADDRYAALDTLRQVWISDAGATSWQPHAIDTEEAVMALTCDPENRLWVVGSFSTILSSEDDGESWNEDSLGEDAQLTAVQFVDADTAYITGEFGMVLKSTDAGASWERASDLPGEFYPQAAHFVDADRGWVVGLNGAIMHTADGGESWQIQDSGVNLPLYGISGTGETLFAVGENGIVLQYEAGSWKTVPHENNILSYLRASSAGNASLTVAGGNGVLLTLATNG